MTAQPLLSLAIVGQGAHLALAGWLAILAAATVAKTGLRPRSAGTGAKAKLHLHRLQLLTATLGFAGFYAGSALLGNTSGAMPAISPFVLGLLGVSQTTYLGGKAFRTIAARRRQRRPS